MFLPLDLGEVGGVGWGWGGHRVAVGVVGRNLAQPLEVGRQLSHILAGDHVQVADEGGLAGVVRGDDDGGDTFISGEGGDGQDAVDVAYRSIEGELADDQRVLDGLGPYLLGGDEDGDGDGEIVGRSLLADIRRGEVDGDALAGEHEPRVLYGRTDALPRFLDGRIREADDSEARHTAGCIDLDLDDEAVEALQSTTGHFGEHRRLLEI